MQEPIKIVQDESGVHRLFRRQRQGGEKIDKLIKILETEWKAKQKKKMKISK